MRIGIIFTGLVVLCLAFAAAAGWFSSITNRAVLIFGPPADTLQPIQRWRLAWRLVRNVEGLTLPVDPTGKPTSIQIEAGDPVELIIARLDAAGLLKDATLFRDYLIYSGADTRILPGEYFLSPAQTGLEIGAQIQRLEFAYLQFVVLAGWRVEEIAASLPTSGLAILPEEFIRAARRPVGGSLGAFWPDSAGHEGLLFPQTYSLPRGLSAEALLDILVSGFEQRFTPDLASAWAENGLDLLAGVTLASIIQREAVHSEEMALIAGVYLNRLDAGIKLDADPTVQYALGLDPSWGWWKSPLSLTDLQVDSAFNTYLISGLPPGPIANPGLAALEAVAYPQPSEYLYFQAACDESGLHAFARTFEEHLKNRCP